MKILEVTQQDIFYNQLTEFRDPDIFVDMFKSLDRTKALSDLFNDVSRMIEQMGFEDDVYKEQYHSGIYSTFIRNNLYITLNFYTKPVVYGFAVILTKLTPDREIYRVIADCRDNKKPFEISVGGGTNV